MHQLTLAHTCSNTFLNGAHKSGKKKRKRIKRRVAATHRAQTHDSSSLCPAALWRCRFTVTRNNEKPITDSINYIYKTSTNFARRFFFRSEIFLKRVRKIYFFSRGGQRQLSLTWRNVKRNSLRFLREETIKKIVSLLTCANWKVSLPGDQGEGLYIHTYISRYILPANIATDWLNGSLLRSRANRWNRKSSRQHEPRCVCSSQTRSSPPPRVFSLSILCFEKDFPYVRRKCRPQFKYRVYDVSFSPPPLFAQTGRHRQQGRRRESPSSLASKFICLRGPSFLSLLPFSLSFFFSPSFPLAYRASLLRPVNITLPSNLHNYRNL